MTSTVVPLMLYVRRNRTSIVIKIIPAFAATRQIKRDSRDDPSSQFSRAARIIPGVTRTAMYVRLTFHTAILLQLFVEEGRTEIIAITMQRVCNTCDTTVIPYVFAAWLISYRTIVYGFITTVNFIRGSCRAMFMFNRARMRLSLSFIDPTWNPNFNHGISR